MAEDRRSRRSRRLLRRAFVELILERGFAAVTVEEISERADVGRATFYAHYSDKDALLDAIVTDLITEMQQRLDPVFLVTDRRFAGAALLALFTHADEERDAYRVVLRGEGDGRALRRFVADRTAAMADYFLARAQRLGAQMQVEPVVLAHSWVGEAMAVLTWWIDAETTLTPREITDQLVALNEHGRYWAAGVEGRD